MTGIKISALPAIVAPATSDVFPVVQSGVTYEETIAQLFTLLGTDAIFTNPQITGCIFDSNGNEILCFSPAASAVNHVLLTNSATGGALGFGADGTDTNIIMSLTAKGTGGVQIQGSTAAINASAGFVGELISSVIPFASAVSLATGTPVNVTSISLTAGDWDIYGNINIADSVQTLSAHEVWASLTSATLPDPSLYNGYFGNTNLYAFDARGIPFLRVNVNTTTTAYLSARAVFGSGTVTACGGIYARRVR